MATTTKRRPLFAGVRLGRVGSIELRVDWSLVIIFALIFFSLGAGVFPAWHPEWGQALVWGTALLASVLFFVSVLLHELSHAVVGNAMGVSIRRITLFLFGGLAEMEDEPPSPKAELAMAAVGPLTSIVIGVAATLAGSALLAPPEAGGSMLDALREASPLTTLLLWLGPVNLLLGIFNALPGFPLDGGRVLRALLWWITGDLRRATLWASSAGQLLGYLLIASGLVMLFGYSVPVFGRGAGEGLWIILIGLFLSYAARASYQQLVVKQALADVSVRDVMRAAATTVPPTLDVATLVHEYMMRSDQHSFPVVDGDDLVGIVALEDIRKAPRDRWPSITVGDIMTPAGSMDAIAPDSDALSAFRQLAVHESVPIVDHGRLVGLARRDDFMKWLAIHGVSPS